MSKTNSVPETCSDCTAPMTEATRCKHCGGKAK